MRNNSFKLIFKDKNNQEIDLDYQLHDSVIAEKWFKKIKHLKNIPIDLVESYQTDTSNFKKIYIDFCKFANIEPIKFKTVNQDLLNKSHNLFEKMHNKLSKKKNNSILYKFHYSIHSTENSNRSNKHNQLYIAWGAKEGPLTETFNCNEYYENYIKKNNIYLPWAELGKTPHNYWLNQEPNDQKRVNELCKPHITFRGKFFIAIKDRIPLALDSSFYKWFEEYSKKWFEHYKIKKWDEIDEGSAPLLAVADHTHNISGLIFKKIVF